MYRILALLTTLPALEVPQDPPPAPAPEAQEVREAPEQQKAPEKEQVAEREAAFPERKASVEALRRHLMGRVAERRASAQAAMGDLLADLGWSYEENQDIVEKRIAAIVALGPLVSDLLVEKIVDAEGDKSRRNLSRNAARCLHRMGDLGVLPDLERLARNPAPQVRADAALALGGLK